MFTAYHYDSSIIQFVSNLQVTKGFPAKPLTRASNEDGLPAYLVDQHGHLMPRFKKAVRFVCGLLPQDSQKS